MARVEIIGPISSGWQRLPRVVRWAATVGFLAFMVILPNLKIPILNTPDSDFATVLFFPIGIYVLIALGLNVVVGEAGLLDLGYVAFFAVGGYSMAVLGTKAGVPFFLILPAGIILSMTAGVILGGPTLRLRGDYLAIVTLGFGEIVHLVAQNTDSIGGPRGINNIPHPPSFRLGSAHVNFG
ncbi:MAG TPA: hypothetical protein VLL25_10695, partial [Acidimicrobiales bacterium]|nr:hypothetical protein [Acidimicrobiales bacterium]